MDVHLFDLKIMLAWCTLKVATLEREAGEMVRHHYGLGYARFLDKPMKYYVYIYIYYILYYILYIHVIYIYILYIYNIYIYIYYTFTHTKYISIISVCYCMIWFGISMDSWLSTSSSVIMAIPSGGAR